MKENIKMDWILQTLLTSIINLLKNLETSTHLSTLSLSSKIAHFKQLN